MNYGTTYHIPRCSSLSFIFCNLVMGTTMLFYILLLKAYFDLLLEILWVLSDTS
jgi:hypothetical protein